MSENGAQPLFWSTVLLSLAIFVLSTSALFLLRSYLRANYSSLGDLPGPKRVNWLKGNFTEVTEIDSARLVEQWVHEYGHVYKYHSHFGSQGLLTVDPKAVSHILSNGTLYQKSELVRWSLREVVGEGLVYVEGAEHKKQRRIMNPAFGPVQIRRLTEIFVEKSLELRDVWAGLSAGTTRQDGRYRLDAFAWLNKVTLDIIGLAGFDYSFDALHSSDDNPNELYDAVHTLSSAPPRGLLFYVQVFFPLARHIPSTRSRSIAGPLKTLNRIGSKLIADKKAAILSDNGHGGESTVEKQDFKGHDLLSLLIKSNMAQDVPENMRMTDAEVLAQMPTFLLAGHETTSSSVTWALYALSIYRDVQAKLREEIAAYTTDTPTMDDLNSLPYLDGVVRETLRLYTPVSSSQRVAMQDDVIPVSKPYVDIHGVTRNEIRVAKGDPIVVPVHLMNRSVELWGEDANEFKPDRWEHVPEAAHAIPSVYSHLLTFISGNHACIGYRFAVIEMKALLFTLVRSFEFDLALPADDITRRTVVVGRPTIATNPGAGAQLPLLIRPVKVD